MTIQNLLSAGKSALAYAERGWRVFPLHSLREGRCTCGRNCGKNAAKHPRVTGGFKAATTDARQIEAWWRKWPDANIGIATGAVSGIVVIDIDGANGHATLQALVAQHGALPQTPIVKTARGWHLYFAIPAACAPILCSTGNGLDVRGAGGYVVAPPSRHASGHVYLWCDGVSMMADPPPWLQEWARNRNNSARPAGSMIAALGEPPAYLKNKLKATPSIAERAAHGRASWSAHDEARLRSALATIPAIERSVWFTVGAAIHEARWGALGYEIWREWSQTAPEKYNDDDQVRTWKSFDRTRDNGQRRTLATVFHLASERGWTGNNPANEKIRNQSNGGANSRASSEESETHSAADDGDADATFTGEESNTRSAADVDDEIRRLAKLSMIEYERERKDAAGRLNLRASILDRLVAAERRSFENGDKQGHAVNLPEPEPWREPVDGAELLRELSAVIRRHVVMFEHAADTAALWTAHTYLLDCFGISPRLAITSPEKGCGKTTALDVLSRLIFRPLPTANASASAIFRVVESQRPTLLIDEADTFLPENEELRGILNSGHRQGGSVIRTVGEDFEPRSFSTYSACTIALIGKLPATLADRSVPIELRRRRADEAIEAFRFDRTKHLEQLARKAARWAIDNADRIRGGDPDMPAGVFNRAADNWRPLLAIADAAGGEWPTRARRAVQCAGANPTGDDQSARILLLSDIRTIFAERRLDRIPSADLVTALNCIEGRPWAEWSRGKGISPNGLARLLAPFAIAPATIRTAAGTPKGYLLAQFEDAFARYLPKVEF
jgi:putative DNA primase/helicase